MAYKPKGTRASQVEISKAAYHELGHAFIAHELGVKVFSIHIRRDAGGMCDMGPCKSIIEDLKITVAGYVCECLATGVEPTSAGLRADPTQDQDLKVIDNIGGSGRVKIWIALPAAMKYCQEVMTRPENMVRIDSLARTLVRRGYLNGKAIFPDQ